MNKKLIALVKALLCFSVLVLCAPPKTNGLKRRRVACYAAAPVFLNNELGISSAVALLREGGVVALPTETVYGLAADATNVDAVNKIFAAKGRPADHPLIVHIKSFDDVKAWADEIPPVAEILAKVF